MKSRSPLEICLPHVIFAVASMASLPTLIIAVVRVSLSPRV
jgi:hypothetical protein